jgi:uncharacterized membrane protein
MSTDEQPTTPHPRVQCMQRLGAFSDGVVVVAITLLVLDLAVPNGSERHALRRHRRMAWLPGLPRQLRHRRSAVAWPQRDHRVLERTDSGSIRLNLLLLLVVALLPIPTRLLAEYSRASEARRTATTI